MTKSVEELKALVQEVHKLATPFKGSLGPAAPGATSPDGGHPFTPGKVAPTGHTGGLGNAGIVDMQRAIIGLAKDVAAQIDVSKVNSPKEDEKRAASGRDAFGVFLTKNYMRNTHVQGVQFDPDPKKVEMDSKNPQAPTRMSVVMDTMSRIGGPLNKNGGEFTADGKWGPRTNAAVRNVYAFAAGLFDFIKDINRFSPRKITPSSYREADLQQLGNIAQTDPNAVSQEEKVKFAPAVAAHVRAIQNMYHEIKTDVLEHPAFMQYIQEDDTFTQGPQKGTTLTPDQLKSLGDRYKEGFPIPLSTGGNMGRIFIEDLSSLDKVQEWIKKFPGTNLTPAEIVKYIQEQTKPSSNEPGY